MNFDRIKEKLAILADAAKYDVSCASSGSKRKNENGGLGNAEGMGICHTYTEDGRCVSLLKILLTNHCVYDCAYCVSRKSNDVQRAAFSVKEVVDLTINFYRRNYIEGLFLSSGIFKDSDYTMERLVCVVKELRITHKFNGYIHLKTIPSASEELIHEAGMYADRLSVNIEMPSERSLKKIAPEKSFAEAYKPMNFLQQKITASKEEKSLVKKQPLFVPAGQSTQMIIGASPESDLEVLNLSSSLYKEQKLKRVYYSGYVPVSTDNRLPILKSPPVIRENRLYQSDWLMRFYGFKVNEIVSEKHPDLDLEIDPKLSYALRNPQHFPVNLQKAEYAMILRVPGIGVKSAKMILAARKHGRIQVEHLKRMGIAYNRARFFIELERENFRNLNLDPYIIRNKILRKEQSSQLSLF